MEFNKELFDQIEKIHTFKRETNPLDVAVDNICSELFHLEATKKLFLLGQASILSWICDKVKDYMCADCQNLFELIRLEYEKDPLMKELLDSLSPKPTFTPTDMESGDC